LLKGEINMGVIVSAILTVVIAAVVILIVSKLNLGLSVAGFGAAIIAAIVIAVVGAAINWLLGLLGITIGGGLLGLIVYLVVAAVVLMISDKFVPGMKVNGFGGAIIAAIAIAVVSWLFGLLLGALGIVF
jgi:putative membrane protein